MAVFWLCCHLSFGNTATLFVRLARRGGLDCALFGSERIHVGAYEAFILADVSLCDRPKLLLSGQRGFLVRKAAWNSPWSYPYSNHFLHLQRCDRNLSRLDQYCLFLSFRGDCLSLRNEKIQPRNCDLQKSKIQYCSALYDCRSFYGIHLQNARA